MGIFLFCYSLFNLFVLYKKLRVGECILSGIDIKRGVEHAYFGHRSSFQ